LNFNQEGT